MEKFCSRCNKLLSFDCFQKNSSNKDGLQSWCRSCRKESFDLSYKKDKRLYDSLLYQKNKEIRKNKARLYYKNNKTLIYTRVKIRYSADSAYRLSSLLRRRMSKLITRQQRAGSAIRDLGCSLEHLKLHLELFWDAGMSWSNYGKKDGWVVDHIIPLGSFDLTNRRQFLVASHFTNLQPLWYVDNQIKVKKDIEYIRKKKGI